MNGFEIQCVPGGGLPEMIRGDSDTAYPEDWFFEAMTWGHSDSGERVNPVTALSHGPVWQAINILAGDVGQLPWHKMVKLGGGGAEKDMLHPLDWLISEQPNPWQTPSVWREMTMGWALGWGNGISAIFRGRNGERVFLPLLPDRTSYVADDEFGFLITTRIAEREVALTPDETYHIRGLTNNGFWGLSAVNICRNVIGHGLALRKHGSTFFKNGARPGGVLEHPQKLGVPERANLRKEWNEIHSGAANSNKIAVLWEGMKYNAISMSNLDSQWLEGVDIDREFIAGLFNLPGFKLGAMKNSAVRANLEEQNRDYFNTSLSRWLNRFNEEAKRKLLSMNERRSRKHFFRWFPEAFLRGDIQKRYAAYSQGITGRFLNPNEVREKEDMNPYDGGDEFLNPAIDVANQNPPAAPPADDEVDPDAPPKKDEAAMALARSLVQSQVTAMLDVEANRIERAAKGTRNFVKSAADFYENYGELSQKYLELPAEVAKNSGFTGADWRAASEFHSSDSLNRLLAMTDLVNKEGLAEAAAQFAADVRSQVEKLTAAVLGDSGNA